MRFAAVLSVFGLAGFSCATALTAGDVLVTDVRWRTVSEYTREGAFVQSFFVPWGPGQDSTDWIRDVAVDAHGGIEVYNGTPHGCISSLDVGTETWTHHLPSGTLPLNGCDGKLAIYGNYVFATDFSGDPGRRPGIARLNLLDGTWVRFAPQPINDDQIDLTIGADGLLYSLDGSGSPSGRYIEAFNPVTMALVKHVELPTSFVWGLGSASREIAVDASGNFYLNQLYGPVYKLSPNLDVIGTYTYTQTGFVDDMDVASDGEVMLTESDRRVVLLNSSFQQVGTFMIQTAEPGSESSGCFVESPVPEPASLIGLATGAAAVLMRRRKRC